MANTSQFTIMKEDHTVANLLVSYLRKHPNVRFAAYKSMLSIFLLSSVPTLPSHWLCFRLLLCPLASKAPVSLCRSPSLHTLLLPNVHNQSLHPCVTRRADSEPNCQLPTLTCLSSLSASRRTAPSRPKRPLCRYHKRSSACWLSWTEISFASSS